MAIKIILYLNGMNAGAVRAKMLKLNGMFEDISAKMDFEPLGFAGRINAENEMVLKARFSFLTEKPSPKPV